MRLAIALALVVTMSSRAHGQVAERSSCVEPAEYANCALWVEQGRLRRGCTGLCTRTDDDSYIPAGALILDGTVANLISVPFTIRGNRFAAKAVFWHNARFAQPR